MNTTSEIASTQYLTFRLAGENYGIEVQCIREILELPAINRVPRTPEHMLGVMNLRGSVVPVVDLRLKFGLEAGEQTVDSAVIVVELDQGEDQGSKNGSTLIGALVDGVEEVLELGGESVEPAPKYGTGFSTDYLKGMGKRDEHFILLLDVGSVFSSQELEPAQPVD